MLDDVDRLKALLGAPEFAPSPVLWSNVEAELGLALPQDYKAFCDYYPAMELDDFLYLTHPTAHDKNDNFLSEAVIQGAALGELVEEDPHQFAYGSYPALGGLLAWGVNAFGQNLYWATEGKPNDWKVVTGDLVDYHFVYDGNFSSFLLETLEGTIQNPVLGHYNNRLQKIVFKK
ncbi:SMI1/KNR4 family protein [Amycolatopsis thailandensis]|uniref:SMI1/KNR4 family protein n=1 Tax=Amycolatopsis thailandensis TaxID=589330 RepID=UPI0037979042